MAPFTLHYYLYYLWTFEVAVAVSVAALKVYNVQGLGSSVLAAY